MTNKEILAKIAENKTIINLTQERLTAISEVIEANRVKRNLDIKEHLKRLSLVPDSILAHDFEVFLNYSNLCLRWRQFSQPSYTSEIEIYFLERYSMTVDKDGTPEKFKFEIACQSSRIAITNDNSDVVEIEDVSRLSLYISLVQELNKKGEFTDIIIAAIKDSSKDSSSTYEYSRIINNLDRENRDLEEQIEACEFANIKEGDSIPSIGDLYKGRTHQRRRGYIDSYHRINILKKTKTGNFKIVYIKENRNDQNEINSNRTIGSARLTEAELIRILLSNKRTEIQKQKSLAKEC